ncbi:MAG: phage tail protein [Anaerolineaceae bacterium]|nr:phage tail protein [Anaerolineaceae bacterium]MCB9100303.1 phage tail protein [Anaerolineales bacterium]
MRDAHTDRNYEDPLLVFKFQVEIEGIIEGFFTECSGLSVEREVETYKEGGLNNYEHKLPGRLKYGNVTLKRGMTTSQALLWDWFHKNADDGKEFFQVKRNNVTIKQLDLMGNKVKEWTLSEAYPVKWKGADLKSDGNQVAIETLELAHHGIHLE